MRRSNPRKRAGEQAYEALARRNTEYKSCGYCALMPRWSAIVDVSSHQPEANIIRGFQHDREAIASEALTDCVPPGGRFRNALRCKRTSALQDRFRRTGREGTEPPEQPAAVVAARLLE